MMQSTAVGPIRRRNDQQLRNWPSLQSGDWMWSINYYGAYHQKGRQIRYTIYVKKARKGKDGWIIVWGSGRGSFPAGTVGRAVGIHLVCVVVHVPLGSAPAVLRGMPLVVGVVRIALVGVVAGSLPGLRPLTSLATSTSSLRHRSIIKFIFKIPCPVSGTPPRGPWLRAPKQVPPPHPANKKTPAALPGPGNYSSNNIGKHCPAWKYHPNHAESARRRETPSKPAKGPDPETTIWPSRNQPQDHHRSKGKGLLPRRRPAARPRKLQRLHRRSL